MMILSKIKWAWLFLELFLELDARESEQKLEIIIVDWLKFLNFLYFQLQHVRYIFSIRYIQI